MKKTKYIAYIVITVIGMAFTVGCSNKDESGELDNVATTAESNVVSSENETANMQNEESQESVKEDKTANIQNEKSQESVEEDKTMENTNEESNITEDVTETSIADYIAMTEYMKNLESSTPEIIIYNENEGYLIRMEEGQHYKLKETDKILFNKGLDGYGFKIALGSQYSEYPEYVEYKADYSGWSGEEEFTLQNNATGEELACYLTAPVKQ